MGGRKRKEFAQPLSAALRFVLQLFQEGRGSDSLPLSRIKWRRRRRETDPSRKVFNDRETRKEFTQALRTALRFVLRMKT